MAIRSLYKQRKQQQAAAAAGGGAAGPQIRGGGWDDDDDDDDEAPRPHTVINDRPLSASVGVGGISHVSGEKVESVSDARSLQER
ncbi:MAG: hypothetical protein Q9191_007781, partial [Dirinaria sp. TL-2023a]